MSVNIIKKNIIDIPNGKNEKNNLYYTRLNQDDMTLDMNSCMAHTYFMKAYMDYSSAVSSYW